MRQNDFSLQIRSFLSLKKFSFIKNLLFFSLLLSLASCEEASFIGLEIQPESDRFVVRQAVDSEISSSVFERDSIVGSSLSRSLLGVVNDPLFGISKSSFITQAAVGALNHDFGTDPQAESLILYLRIGGTYGDELASQDFQVYEVNVLYQFDSTYFSNTDVLQMIDQDAVLASYTYTPAEGDTIIAIPLTNQDFQQKLLAAPDSAMSSIGQFITYVNGLYVTSSLTSETGVTYSIDLNHNNSYLSLNYTNSDVPDSIMRYNYVITQDANKINLFEHDYSTAVFFDDLNQTGTEDPQYYVQGISGVKARLDFDYLNTFRDSMPVSINSARLILPIDTDDQTSEQFAPPARLTLLEENQEGEMYSIRDVTLGDDYFGGVYNEELGQYSFNITSFVQAYIKDDTIGGYLYVTVRDPGIIPNRVVLRGENHTSGGPEIEITYTKY